MEVRLQSKGAMRAAKYGEQLLLQRRGMQGKKILSVAHRQHLHIWLVQRKLQMRLRKFKVYVQQRRVRR